MLDTIRLKNRCCNRDTRLTEVNHGITFATTGGQEVKGSKRKHVTCFECKKVGHYSNESDEDATIKASNEKGLSF